MAQANPEILLGHHRCCPGKPNYQSKEVIFSPGDSSDCLFYLHYGRVKLYHVTPNGHQLTLDLLGQERWFGGKAGWLGAIPDILYAEAMSDVCVCSVDRRLIERAFEEQPTLIRSLLETLNRRQQAMITRLTEMIFADVPTRLAQALLIASKNWGQKENDAIKVTITHLDLARLAGSTRETTTVCLHRLARLGMIETHHRAIYIKDRKRLMALADQDLTIVTTSMN